MKNISIVLAIIALILLVKIERNIHQAFCWESSETWENLQACYKSF